MNHVFKLEEEEYRSVQELDHSIGSWSLQLGKVELQLETIKAQLFGNYEARQNLLKRVVKDAGFDLSKVDDIKIGQGGQVMVIMADPQKEAPPGRPAGTMVNGVQTGPPGNPPEKEGPSEPDPPEKEGPSEPDPPAS